MDDKVSGVEKDIEMIRKLAAITEGVPLSRRVRVLEYMSHYYAERMEMRDNRPPDMEKAGRIMSEAIQRSLGGGDLAESIKRQAKEMSRAFGISEDEAMARLKRQFLGDDSDNWRFKG